MRVMPSIPMFWVISTAQVLQGVIISRRGPTNGALMVVASSSVAFPKSQVNFSIVSAEKLILIVRQSRYGKVYGKMKS